MITMTATAPGKLILTGEYAVLDGAPALVIAVDRRVIARPRGAVPAGSSPFLIAVANELAARRGGGDPAVRAATELAVDSSAFYDGVTKLGLGSSAAVTVAATALALGAHGAPLDRAEVLAIASAAHAAAQGERGVRGSGADVAAAVHGGTIAFTAGRVERRRWPAAVTLLPFFTGTSADTPTLVAAVLAARAANPVAVDAALVAVADASKAACAAIAAPGELAVTAGDRRARPRGRRHRSARGRDRSRAGPRVRDRRAGRDGRVPRDGQDHRRRRRRPRDRRDPRHRGRPGGHARAGRGRLSAAAALRRRGGRGLTSRHVVNTRVPVPPRSSRLTGFYRLGVLERRRQLLALAGLPAEGFAAVDPGALALDVADGMIENVVGTYALPFAVAVNFVVDERRRR